MREAHSRKWSIFEMRKGLRGALHAILATYLNQYPFRFSDAYEMKNFDNTVEIDGKDCTYAFKPEGELICPAWEAAAGRSSKPRNPLG